MIPCWNCTAPLTIFPDERRFICARCREEAEAKAARKERLNGCACPGCPRPRRSGWAPTCEPHRKGWTPCEVRGCPHKVGPIMAGKRCPKHSLPGRLHTMDARPGRPVRRVA